MAELTGTAVQTAEPSVEPAWWRRAVPLAAGFVIAGSLTGGISFDLLGFSVRPEHVATLVLAGVILATSQGRAAVQTAVRHRVVIIFAVFLAWGAIASAIYSPSLLKSAATLGWLGLDWLLLVLLLASGTAVNLVYRASGLVSAGWAIVGFAAFTAANTTRGDWGWGTHFEYAHNVYLTSLTAFESNIYATILLLWTMIFALGRRRSWRALTAIALVFPLGLIAAQTRTAFGALLAGCLLYIGLELLEQIRARKLQARTFAAPLALLVGAFVIVTTYGALTAALTPAAEEMTIEVQEGPKTTTVVVPANPGDTQVGLNKLSDVEEVEERGGTLEYRWRILQTASTDMTGWNLVLGNGVNTYPLRHDRPAEYGPGEGDLSILPAQILYDMGIVGLLLLFAMLLAVLASTPAPRRSLAFALVGTFFVASSLTSVFWFSITWIVFAMLIRPADEVEPAS